MTDMFPNYNGRSEEQNANEKKNRRVTTSHQFKDM